MKQVIENQRTARKDDVIQIRASGDTKAILQQAANLRGQKLSEFMLEIARRHAEDAILNQRTFFLDAKAHEKFLALLDSPSKANAELRKRARRKPIWSR